MKLLLFYIGSMLAAGSTASPCSPSNDSSASPQNQGVKKPVELLAQNQNTPPVVSSAPPIASSTAGIVPLGSFTIQPGVSNPPAGSVPASSSGNGFCNTVFNTGASKNSGWPAKTWSTLTANGVNEWIGFSLPTLNDKSTYNTAAGPAAVTAQLNNAQIHVVMDPTDVSAAVTMLQSSPPPYLELFNEPDYSFAGVTPLTDPVTAAKDLQQVFQTSHPSTTFISPALANANSQWLPTFRDNCNNCFAQIPIIAMHLYSADTNNALNLIKQLHGTWPDKKIWITELSPAEASCSLDSAGIVNWINTLIPQIQALGYVEKIFWNCGESAASLNGASASCNPSLTNDDGSATAILTAYGKVCGVAPAGGSTATS